MVEINIRTRRVDEVDTERGLTLLLSGGAAIRIECPFDLEESDAVSVTIDPENVGAVQRLGSMLRGRVVEVATADDEAGLLSVIFIGGLALTVPPDPDFEAWLTTAADGSMIVALPGGGLSFWGRSSDGISPLLS
jgi:hypothetical protein